MLDDSTDGVFVSNVLMHLLAKLWQLLSKWYSTGVQYYLKCQGAHVS